MTPCCVIHGDSRLVDWRELLDGRSVDCIVTDPPFGVDYRSRRVKTNEGKELAARGIANDASELGAIQCYLDAMRPLLELAAPQCELYTFTRWDVIGPWRCAIESLEDLGFKFKAMLIWDKGNLGMGDIDASWGASYEVILYAKKGRRDLNTQRSSVLRFDRPSQYDRIHPTEKPVALLEVLIRASTDRGGLVVDPFAGSGSTIVAAQRTGRHGLGIEHDPSYARRASDRLSQQLLF